MATGFDLSTRHGRLRWFIKTYFKTNKAFAARIGKAEAQVSEWARGVTDPSPENVGVMREHAELNDRWYYYNEGDPKIIRDVEDLGPLSPEDAARLAQIQTMEEYLREQRRQIQDRIKEQRSG